MTPVDFSDVEGATAWFEAQSREMRSTMASRAALRIVGTISYGERQQTQGTTLAILRAILTTAVVGFARTDALRKQLISAAGSAEKMLRDTQSGFQYSRSAESAARSAANAAALSENSHALAVAYSADAAAHAQVSSKSDGRTAHEAAHVATQSDSSLTVTVLTQSAAWRGSPIPEAVFLAHAAFMQNLHNHPDWAFWADWYRGMWDGTFRDWDLAIEVVKIPDDVWEGDDAVAAVAEAIRELEARRALEPLDQDALKKHSTHVVAYPSVHADFAQSISLQISNAVASFKADAKTNALPDGFEQFERLPGAFEALSRVLQSDTDKDAKIAALVAKVNDLHATNLRLRQDLTDARLELSTARLTKVEAAQMRTFGEKAQTFLTNVTLVGAMGMGMFHFFGIEESELKYDALKQQLDDLTQDMEKAQPALETDPAP